jgi:hypothetical protein
MSMIVTENRQHNSNLAAAELARQVASAPGATAAQIKAADIAYHRAALASALKNGCGVEPFLVALRDLGVGGL